MAGIPPLAGFFSKYYVLNAVLARGVTALVIIGLIVSLISAYYYLRIIATF
jgi:NADH-quinone oxidoreductase subunit N